MCPAFPNPENYALEAQAFAQWFPVGGAVWGSLLHKALLEEMCHWGWALCSTSSSSFPVLCLRLKMWSLRVPISHLSCPYLSTSPSHGFLASRVSAFCLSTLTLWCQAEKSDVCTLPAREARRWLISRPSSGSGCMVHQDTQEQKRIHQRECCAKPEVDTVNN